MYGCQLVRVAKLSVLKKNTWSSVNVTSFNQLEQVCKEIKKKSEHLRDLNRYFRSSHTWVAHLNKWKHFRRQFLLFASMSFCLTVFLFCMFSVFQGIAKRLSALWNYWSQSYLKYNWRKENLRCSFLGGAQTGTAGIPVFKMASICICHWM